MLPCNRQPACHLCPEHVLSGFGEEMAEKYACDIKKVLDETIQAPYNKSVSQRGLFDP